MAENMASSVLLSSSASCISVASIAWDGRVRKALTSPSCNRLTALHSVDEYESFPLGPLAEDVGVSLKIEPVAPLHPFVEKIDCRQVLHSVRLVVDGCYAHPLPDFEWLLRSQGV